MEEIWHQIMEFPNYMVSNYGNVLNTKKNKLMTIYKRKSYCLVKLSNNNIAQEKKVHRLVAQAFIPNPNGFCCVNHKDENPGNNNVENLEWCDHKYNNTYGNRTKRQGRKMQVPVLQYDKDMNLIAEYSSVNEAGAACKINPCNISNCLSGRQKTSGNYIWTYKTE